MKTFIRDIRYGMRMLRKKPMFTTVALLTLALGVGANTAIFSIVNAVLLRPLPFHDSDRLVRITFSNSGVGLRGVPFSVPELDDLRTRAGVFEDVSALVSINANLTGAKQPERLEALIVSPNYFSMLGAPPQLGRVFGPQDFTLGFAPSVVISDGLWRRSYAADPNVIGRTVQLDNDPYTIVGVLPPGFRHPGRTLVRDVELWCTSGFSAHPYPSPPTRSTRLLPGAMGRLKPGLTLQQAQAQLTVMANQLRRDFPTDYPPEAHWTIEIQPLQEALVGNVRPMLLVLQGAVVLIVFIVSLNIANLLLARASGRQQEMAVRLALGATRGRMVRQMLTESMLLSCIGGVVGITIAAMAMEFLLRLIPTKIPRLNEVNIDWTVLAVALVISILTGLLFGLVPAMQASRFAPSRALREGARGSGYSARTRKVRDLLIVSEVTFAIVLMVAAGLLLRTVRQLLQEDPGFDPALVVTAHLWLPVPNDAKADPYLGFAKQNAFSRELLRRMDSIPGVQLAAITSNLPAENAQIFSDALAIEDHRLESSQNLRSEMVRISPDFFKVIQVPLVRGRFFTESDQNDKEPVAIIDEATARRYWVDHDPVGRRLRLGQLPWMRVVGIVKDIKNDGLDMNGIPHIYVPIYQTFGRSLSVVLRSSLPATQLEPRLRQEIQVIDPSLPVFNVSSMTDVIDKSLASRYFSANLVGGFAAVALLLSSLGIYGLMAFMVGQRSREIGLRMALGAKRGDILKLFLRKAVLLAGIGVIIGVVLSASTAPMMASLLYGIRPHDPAVFLVAPVVLLVVAVLASYIPARRAAKADPMFALRDA